MGQIVMFGGSDINTLINAAVQLAAEPLHGHHPHDIRQLHLAQGAGGDPRQDQVAGALLRLRTVLLGVGRGKLELLAVEELFCVMRTAVAFRYHGVLAPNSDLQGLGGARQRCGQGGDPRVRRAGEALPQDARVMLR